jgi:predicted enzyme related to lactoylglutathione lyase
MDKAVHFEIPFDDKKRATDFYKQTFGWDLIDIGQMDYVLAHAAATDANNMVTEPGAINGGLFPRSAEAKNPIICFAVASVEEKIKAIESAGGKKIMDPVAIPNGRYARVADSEGNIIGLVDSLR